MIQIVITAIDAVHSAKTQFVKTFVPNEELKKPIQTFIDAQSAYAKSVAHEANKFFTTMGIVLYMFDAAKAFSTK